MNQNVLSLLQTLGGLPNWKYSLGLAQLAPQEQQNQYQYQLGQQSLADQMQQFQQAQALAQAQQQWQQQFQTQGQQFGEQQTAAQNQLANQAQQIQNQYLPAEILRQLTSQLPSMATAGQTRNPGARAASSLPTLSWTNPAGVTQAGWPTQ